MDELEQALKLVLKKEAEKFDVIKCYINHKECTKCQPLCTYRRKYEERNKKLQRVRQIRLMMIELDNFKNDLNKELDELEKELDIK